MPVNSGSPPEQELRRLLNQFQTGHLAEAEASALSLSAKYPAHPLAWKILAAILWQTGRPSDALNAMQRTVALTLQDMDALNSLMSMLAETGRFEEAIAVCKQALQVNRSNPGIHNDLGMLQQ